MNPTPLPATAVVNLPSAFHRRTRVNGTAIWFCDRSPMYRLPSGPTASEEIMPSAAAVAITFSPLNPYVPLPATVVITPSGEIRRTRELPSAIYRPPAGSIARADGRSNAAVTAGPPSPEWPFCPVPATVR